MNMTWEEFDGWEGVLSEIENLSNMVAEIGIDLSALRNTVETMLLTAEEGENND